MCAIPLYLCFSPTPSNTPLAPLIRPLLPSLQLGNCEAPTTLQEQRHRRTKYLPRKVKRRDERAKSLVSMQTNHSAQPKVATALSKRKLRARVDESYLQQWFLAGADASCSTLLHTLNQTVCISERTSQSTKWRSEARFLKSEITRPPGKQEETKRKASRPRHQLCQRTPPDWLACGSFLWNKTFSNPPLQPRAHVRPQVGFDSKPFVVHLYINWGRNFQLLAFDFASPRKTYNTVVLIEMPSSDSELLHNLETFL